MMSDQPYHISFSAQLSDEPQAICNLSPSRSRLHDAPFYSSNIGDDVAEDPYDLVPYIDLVSCPTLLY